MMEGESVSEFLIRLGEDPDLLARYYEDKRGVLAESGLSEEQQELIVSGDVQRIQAELQQEHPEAKVFLLPAWNGVQVA
jgi:hypothetical protein